MRKFSLQLRTVWWEDVQRAGERGCLGTLQQSSAWSLVLCGNHNEFTRLDHQWIIFSKCNLSFMVSLFLTLSLCKDVHGSLHDLSNRDDLQGTWDGEMLPCGWWDRSALAKCPAWQLPMGSWRDCSGPLPQKRGRICMWGAPWGLGGASEPFASSPEINGCPDVSHGSPPEAPGCPWCTTVGQEGNIILEGEEEIQGQCCWCERRSWARWCGRQYPSPSFPSSLATTL